mgnify:CR=1 FL=1
MLVYQTHQAKSNMAQGGGTSDVPLCHKSSLCSLTEMITEFIIFAWNKDCDPYSDDDSSSVVVVSLYIFV